MMHFHSNNCILGFDSKRSEEDADFHAAIRDAGLEGQPLEQKHVKMVFTIFLKSTSGKGVTKKGGAGVPCLPSF